MPTRNVVLTKHQETLIETLVESGRYQTVPTLLDRGLATRSGRACVRSMWPGRADADATSLSIESPKETLLRLAASCTMQWNCVVTLIFRSRKAADSYRPRSA